jgi:probable phosphomutase (TIGR03848 family)
LKIPKQQPITTVLLVRHGENDWTRSDKLAGRMSNVHLNDYGRQQVAALGQRLAEEVKLAAVYSSPLERTMETAWAIAEPPRLTVQPCAGLLEVDYGEWTGLSLKELAKTPLWPVIQFYPSGAAFPGGESLPNMQARLVQTINSLIACHNGQTIAIVSHADPIKAAVAYYLGMPLDLFQRLVIHTAALTTINFSPMGPRVVAVNDTRHVPPQPVNQKKKRV